MSRIIVIAFFSFLTFGVFSQEVILQFNLIDEHAETTIDSAKITIQNPKNEKLFSGWTRNNSEVTLGEIALDRIKITIEHPFYNTLVEFLDLNKYSRTVNRGKSIPLNLKLKYDGQIEEGIDILARYKPTVVFSSERISVSDYAVIGKDSLILLAYPKRLKKGSELVFFTQDKEISRKGVSGTAVEFIRDYRQRLFLRCENQDYIVNKDASLETYRIDRKELNYYVRPIVDTLGESQLYFSNYNEVYPAYDYFKVNLADTTDTLLHHIEDKEIMELYRAEYKWVDVRTKLWAWDMEDETGIDRKIWVGATVFANSIYYEAPYGNLFISDTVGYVFDFYKDLLFKYNGKTGEKLDSIPISFHQNRRTTGWKKELFQDPITKKVYTYFDNSGFIDVREINLENGKLGDSYPLFYRFVENIQIFDNDVYYIYRPFESIQKKYLYKEDLLKKDREIVKEERYKR